MTAADDDAPRPTPAASARTRRATPQRERQALVGSLAVSAVLGTGALVWGVAASADVLVFDGIFTLAGIALSALSILASRTAAQAPSRRFPFGRPAATPLAVAMQGAAIAATLVYAVVDAVATIVRGGSAAAPATLVAYGAASGVVAWATAAWIGRVAPGSDLAAAEAVAWRAGAALSAVVVVGGLVGVLLVHTGHHGAAVYVDPVLVLVAVAGVAALPLRMIRESMHELLEGAPPADVDAAIRAAADAARERFGLPEPVVRATKLGNRLYVEMDFVVAEHAWEVDAEDEVRRLVLARLVELPFDPWVTVELTTDPGLAQ